MFKAIISLGFNAKVKSYILKVTSVFQNLLKETMLGFESHCPDSR